MSATHPFVRVDILLIEDDEIIRQLLIQTLQQCGYSIREAANGREALRLRQTHRFRLVITDLFMPEMDGLEVIMDHNRVSPNVPLLAITGGFHYSSPEDTLRIARVLGSHATIQKPFDMILLIKTVEQLLSNPFSAKLASLADRLK